LQSARRGQTTKLNRNNRADESIFPQKPAGILGYKKATNNQRVGTTFFQGRMGLEWAAFLLSIWKLLVMLEYLSSLSVLAAVLFYFSESGDRTK